jgi:hypothetical protein
MGRVVPLALHPAVVATGNPQGSAGAAPVDSAVLVADRMQAVEVR